MRFLFILLLLMTFIALIHPRSASAQEVVFSEDFSGDFSQWVPTRDDGSAWHIINGQADVYLESGHIITELVPSDAVWNSTWQNLEYELDFIPLSGVDRNISFGIQSPTHWYEIHFVETFYNLVKLKAGNRPFNVNNAFVLENGQSYRIKIVFHTGLIQVYVDGNLIAEEYDASFNQDYGKIGIKVTTGYAYPTHVRFDNIVVRHITDDGFRMNVPDLQQDDPVWSELEYNHAKNWSSDPTFRRWACALTSMVMIMRFHGLDMMPDGQLLTPITLNEWLKGSKDGYVGEGLVNWLAVTRLTYQMSQKYGTPKLEFAAQTTNVYRAALAELAAQRPTILHMPGHFLVGTGYTGNKRDLYINDPFYDHEKFFQHNANLLSLRTFRPSQTDLSHLLISHHPNLKVQITDVDGKILPKLQTVTEFIRATDTPETTESVVTHYLAKPNTQEIQLKVFQTGSQPFSLKIFAYDTTGNLTDLSQQGVVGNMNLTLRIQYVRDGQSSARIHASWLDLRRQLRNLSQKPTNIYYSSYLDINHVAFTASSQSLENQKRYLSLFEYVLDTLQPSMDPEVFRFLKKYRQDFTTQLSQTAS